MVSVVDIDNLLIQKNKKDSFKLIVTSDLEHATSQIITEDDTPVGNIFSEKQHGESTKNGNVPSNNGNVPKN